MIALSVPLMISGFSALKTGQVLICCFKKKFNTDFPFQLLHYIFTDVMLQKINQNEIFVINSPLPQKHIKYTYHHIFEKIFTVANSLNFFSAKNSTDILRCKSKELNQQLEKTFKKHENLLKGNIITY